MQSRHLTHAPSPGCCCSVRRTVGCCGGMAWQPLASSTSRWWTTLTCWVRLVECHFCLVAGPTLLHMHARLVLGMLAQEKHRELS